MNSGVYLIMVGVDTYVGSTTDLAGRYKAHVWKLKCNRHPNRNLQAAWDALGVLSFQVLDLVEVAELIAAEQRWIDSLRPTMNVFRFAGSRGRLGTPMSAASRAKLSLALRGNRNSTGRVLSEEHKRRISAALKGVPKAPRARRRAAAARWASSEARE